MKTAASKALPESVSYADALGHASSDKRIEILRLIGAGGSISQAARDAGVSYKAAWQALDTLTNLAGVALVERAVGGAGGGGAHLTPAGVQLLAAADQLEGARRQVLDGLQSGVANAGRLSGIAQLSVRTSMRNQLPCAVRALEGSGQIVRVQLVLADGGTLVSRITRESAELLALRTGQEVLALCKATAVTVKGAPKMAAAVKQPLSGNLLPGRATRVSRGDSGDEVALRLDSGLQLVGFAAAGSGIRVRSRVQAQVEESAVVVALAG